MATCSTDLFHRGASAADRIYSVSGTLPVSMPTYGTLTTSGFREEDVQTGALRLNATASANIALATRVMAGPAGRLKW